ncbi:glycosyl transferase family 2 [Mucilaginibacter yixingensis]|uniref:Glycosyl transferase family 2 n=1 Tax=Mucilaginibacter yixingensis TaxID=1295612 RepID=A0A2T5JFW6_9SPHI|nr:glycosyltransferase family 2 protein [Mucilaginibacter yixingensis]PTR01284.1 glycosyl transferase family 2 [Mucilaginibacter yixingensis]
MFKISIVLCVYNEGTLIFNALRSLYQNQLFNNCEILIVDDCSNDTVTLRLLQLLQRFTRFKIISSPANLGLSNSRNLGFLNAKSEYVVPLDADDTLPPNTLDIIYQTFTDHPECDFIFGDYYVNETDEGTSTLISLNTHWESRNINIKRLLADWKLLGTSPCKKSTWKQAGGYSKKYSHSIQDVDFWLKVLANNLTGHYLNQPIYNWNKATSGMNATFDRINMLYLLEDHAEFYSKFQTKQYIYNKIFEGYYPYKNKHKLLNLGRRHFFYLSLLNKLRLVNFSLKSIIGK